MDPQRVRLTIGGTVQGVGFRPYVYRLAHALELSGFVRNDAGGVIVEVEGPPTSVEDFMLRLPVERPPLAVCEHIVREDIAWVGTAQFTIAESAPALGGDPHGALIPADVATCDDCLRELLDPTDRRFRYPFINCTNCGPRFTIIRGTPYDRARTTMAGFQMCDPCRSEYDDPLNRRFHAQPNACPVCGPRARLTDAAGTEITMGGMDAVAAAAAACRDGAIVAVKGVGGYHLACLAGDDGAVARLRERKRRPDKPFALMAPDLAWATRLVALDDMEQSLMASRERPIVLARRRRDAPVADGVAPRQRDLGVMLPHSPLHHLLLADSGVPLVMTSGNLSEEPIAYRDAEAYARLAAVADYFLVHDRPIETPTDDSILRVVSIAGRRSPMMLRRSRGYAPAPIVLPVAASAPLLACGGHLKNTYCLVRDRHAWVGPHVGDLEHYDTYCAYTAGIAHHERLLAVSPSSVVHDLHPEYLATKYARDRLERELRLTADTVQHHHAHFASCLAEHGECGPAVGVILDGTGYGTDSDVWGGEILFGDLAHVERVGHLWPVRMPGGEAAIREPWRMACAWLHELSIDSRLAWPATLRDVVNASAWRSIAALARSGVASPWTTSAGRLFDAIAALCGIRAFISYEGQAAIELEAAADISDTGRYDLPVLRREHALILDARVLVAAVIQDLDAAVPVARVAARVHNGMAYAAASAAISTAKQRGATMVVLSGGVFQNSMLLDRTAAHISRAGLDAIVPTRLPPNDGGLSFGQAAVAVARLAPRDDSKIS